jgi:hypothetical protein
MTSIAKFAYQRDPEAIAKIICQELQLFDIDRLGVEVDIVDSNLELQIRADSAIDKEKLLTVVCRELQNLHIESVAKFKIHCWRNDEEMHEQRLLWTEQFVMDLPKSLTRLSLDSKTEAERSPDLALSHKKSPEKSPEPQLSKHDVLQEAIKKISPSNVHVAKDLFASDSVSQPTLDRSVSGDDVANQKSSLIASPLIKSYGPSLLVGLSIVLLGLGVGATLRMLSANSNPEQQSLTLTETPAIAPTPAQVITPKSPDDIQKPANSGSELGKDLNLQQETITLEKFNRIQKGMTIDQVTNILGTSGKLIAKNTATNSLGQVYSWKNPQGSNAIVEFKDGQVVAKAQAGL